MGEAQALQQLFIPPIVESDQSSSTIHAFIHPCQYLRFAMRRWSSVVVRCCTVMSPSFCSYKRLVSGKILFVRSLQVNALFVSLCISILSIVESESLKKLGVQSYI
jgi:hypothetical protein